MTSHSRGLLVSLALIAFGGCSSNTSEVVADRLWVAPLPASLTISWGLAYEEETDFRIVATHCDNCDVDLPTLPTALVHQSTSFTGRARGVGPVTFTADLESDDGEQRTVQVTADGDVPTSLVPSCQQTFAINQTVGPCRPSRSIDDKIEIELSLTTEQHGVLPIFSLIPDYEDTTTLVLPTMSPDAVNWATRGLEIDPNTTATKETLTWSFGGTTLVAEVALPTLR